MVASSQSMKYTTLISKCLVLFDCVFQMCKGGAEGGRKSGAQWLWLYVALTYQHLFALYFSPRCSNITVSWAERTSTHSKYKSIYLPNLLAAVTYAQLTILVYSVLSFHQICRSVLDGPHIYLGTLGRFIVSPNRQDVVAIIPFPNASITKLL